MVLLVPLESSSSSSLFQWKYDVFLSFRGGDTRRSFTDHLYATLHRKGVYAFKDDKELERGKNISLDLLQAIRDSKFSIIIFSKNYADSTWCLEELEIIFECMNQGTLTAIPIFYGVDPSDVQMLTGEYGKAFAKHANDYKGDPEKVLKWRVAIMEVAKVSGWDLQNRHEAEFIQDIVDGLIDQLRNVGSKSSKEEEGLVGIDKHLMQIDLCLRGRSNDVSIIGICGMGGIGKTTIAGALYSRMSSQFEWKTFLLNVREIEEKHSLIRLQEQLLSEIVHENNLRILDFHKGMEEIRYRLRHRKALVILDDVDSLEQLKSLAGRSDWFSPGSVVIITTRNEHLLSYYESYQLYKVDILDKTEALELLCLKAFKRQNPREGYEDLSHGFVEYCKGLPLAIDVIGSFLSGRSKDEWESVLKRLKKIPNKSILDKLQISFDGLEEIEQEIFLDIACFFKGEDQDHVKRILEGCNFYPNIGLRVLIEKSLISIDSCNRIMMHDLLQDMGQEIVRRQSPKEPGERSRIWHYKDVYHVLSSNTGKLNLEAITIEESFKEEEKWPNVEALSTEVFLKMKSLRLLKLPSLNISSGLVGLPNSLRYLNWDRYLSKSLPRTFYPHQLVELRMRNSKVKQLWKGTKVLNMLKVIDLSFSEELTLTPNFTEMPNIEIFNLEGCIKLSEISESIGFLTKLVSLNLGDCRSLTILPNGICAVKSLKTLNLNGCSSLETLPERIGELARLERLDLGGVGTRKVSSAKPWKFLLPWKKQNGPLPLTLPSSLSNLCSLTKLDLSDCHLKLIPFDFGCFPLLERLYFSGNDFVSIPDSINQLSKLVELDLKNCKSLEALPEWPSSICNIDVDGCISLKTFAYNHMMCVPYVHAVNCYKLVENKETNFAVAFLARILQVLVKGVDNPLRWIAGFSFFIPGGDIPKWFTYKTFDDQLTVSLPLNWCNDKFVGFAACSLWGIDTKSKRNGCNIRFEGEEGSTACVNLSDELTTDHLWFVFKPPIGFYVRDLRRIWNKRKNVEVTCWATGEKKSTVELGFRIVYEQDIEELMQYITPSERWRFDTVKRERQDDCDGEKESNIGGSCASSSMELNISSKRLKAPDD